MSEDSLQERVHHGSSMHEDSLHFGNSMHHGNSMHGDSPQGRVHHGDDKLPATQL